MTEFKSFKGKMVNSEKGIVEFLCDTYKTECEIEIKALSNDKDITIVKAKKPKAGPKPKADDAPALDPKPEELEVIESSAEGETATEPVK